MNTWMAVGALLLVGCEQPTTELGSIRAQWQWTSSSLESVRAIATTPDDEIVVLTLAEASQTSVLRMFDAEGGIRWERETGAARDVAVDTAGTLWVVTEEDGQGTLSSYDASGEPLGAHSLPEGVTSPRLALLPDGRVVVSANIDDGATVLAYHPSGELQWTSTGFEAHLGFTPWVGSVATSEAGHVVVGGGSPGDGDSWVARLSGAGQVEWIRTLEGDGAVSGVAVDDDGTVFAVGNERTGAHHWRVNLDDDGTVAWQQVDDRTSPHIIDAAIDGDGGRYWVGSDQRTGVAVVFAAEPDGAVRWHETVSGPPSTTGSTDEDGAVDIAFTASGDVVVGGELDYRGRGGEAWGFRGWLARYASGE